MGNEGFSQIITWCLSCAFLLREREDSSRSSLAPGWNLSHGKSSFMNLSSVGNFHKLQLFLNCSSMAPSMGCSPLGMGYFSTGPPRDDKSCEQTCSSVGSSVHKCADTARSLLQCGLLMTLVSFGHPAASLWHPLKAVGRSLLPRGSPWAAEEQLPHHNLPHGLWRNLCSGTWSIPPLHPPLLLHWLGCLQDCSSHMLSLLTSLAVICFCTITFFPFLNLSFQRHYHHCWQAFPWPAVGPSWSCLALALLYMEEVSSSFSEKSPWLPHPIPKPFYENPIQWVKLGRQNKQEKKWEYACKQGQLIHLNLQKHQMSLRMWSYCSEEEGKEKQFHTLDLQVRDIINVMTFILQIKSFSKVIDDHCRL